MSSGQTIRNQVSQEARGHSTPRFLIEEISTESERREVAKFRYEIYAEEMNLALSSCDDERRVLSDALDASAIILVARVDGEIVATGRLNIVDRKMANKFPELQLLRLIDQFGTPIAVATKFAVRKDYRGTRIFTMIAERLFLRGVRLGVRAYVLHSMNHLVEMYRRMGFREYLGKVTVDGVAYRDGKPVEFEPMYLPCEPHLLRELRSPFYRLVRDRGEPVVTDSKETSVCLEYSGSFIRKLTIAFKKLFGSRVRQEPYALRAVRSH